MLVIDDCQATEWSNTFHVARTRNIEKPASTEPSQVQAVVGTVIIGRSQWHREHFGVSQTDTLTVGLQVGNALPVAVEIQLDQALYF